jgi:hypothetical protein
MKTEYDINLLNSISHELSLSDIVIHEQTDSIVEDIEKKFVMGFNGIDWTKSNVIFSERINLGADEYLLEIGKFLKMIYESYPNLLEAKVIVFGDSLTNLGYEINFKDFVNLYENFISIPQHTYVWFIEQKQCINFTFENEIFFG